MCWSVYPVEGVHLGFSAHVERQACQKTVLVPSLAQPLSYALQSRKTRSSASGTISHLNDNDAVDTHRIPGISCSPWFASNASAAQSSRTLKNSQGGSSGDRKSASARPLNQREADSVLIMLPLPLACITIYTPPPPTLRPQCSVSAHRNATATGILLAANRLVARFEPPGRTSHVESARLAGPPCIAGMCKRRCGNWRRNTWLCGGPWRWAWLWGLILGLDSGACFSGRLGGSGM